MGSDAHEAERGAARLRQRLSSIPAAVKEAARAATLKQANAMAATMRGLVPEDEGDLKESIVVTPGNAATPPYSQPGGSMVVPELSVAVTAGNADVRYAHLVEYGTVERTVKKTGKPSGKGPAQPFFWPAVRLHRKKAQAAIKRGVGTAVRKAWSKR